MNEVFQSVQVLPGVGPKRLEPLAELGIETVYDLLTHFPFRYEDIQIRDVQSIMDQEKVTLKGLVGDATGCELLWLQEEPFGVSHGD